MSLQAILFTMLLVLLLASVVLGWLIHSKSHTSVHAKEALRRRRLLMGESGGNLLWDRSGSVSRQTDFSRRSFIPKALASFAVFLLFRLAGRGVDIETIAARVRTMKEPDNPRVGPVASMVTSHTDTRQHTDVPHTDVPPSHIDVTMPTEDHPHADMMRPHADSPHGDYNTHNDIPDPHVDHTDHAGSV